MSTETCQQHSHGITICRHRDVSTSRTDFLKVCSSLTTFRHRHAVIPCERIKEKLRMGLQHDISSSQRWADFATVCSTLRGTWYYDVIPCENITEQYENNSTTIIISTTSICVARWRNWQQGVLHNFCRNRSISRQKRRTWRNLVLDDFYKIYKYEIGKGEKNHIKPLHSANDIMSVLAVTHVPPPPAHKDDEVEPANLGAIEMGLLKGILFLVGWPSQSGPISRLCSSCHSLVSSKTCSWKQP